MRKANIEQAEPLLVRVLSFYQKLFGAEYPDTARSVLALALLYHNQGKYEQSELLFRRTISIWENFWELNILLLLVYF